MSVGKRKILVTGATGQTGGAVVGLLAGASDVEVIAGARTPEKAKGLGVPVVLLDYDRGATLAPALKGIDSVFMVTGYTVDMLQQSKAFINAAKRANVKRIVHLGAPGDDDTQVGHWGWHQFVERYIEWSGISFTHLRPQIFMQNVLGYGGAQAEGKGVLRHYIGDARISWVDCNDVAAVAAMALRHPQAHAGKTYHLGSEARSYPEIADILTRVTGERFTDESRPPEEFLEHMLAAGADPAYMRCVHQNWIDYARRAIPGQDAVYDNFFGLTGRLPTTWTEFAKTHAAAFRTES
jgi:NAD(P)H dehydrogenase (quinone)